MLTQGSVALWLATSGRGPVAVAGTVVAVGVLLLCWVRLRRGWLYQWLAVSVSYLSRRRRLPAGSGAALLLHWVRPGASLVTAECDGDAAGVIEEARGLTVLLALGRADTLFVESTTPLPALSALHTPGVRLQLVVAGIAPAAGPGAVAGSYRQLTQGRLLARQRIVLAVQAVRDEGASQAELRQVLAGAVRRIRRRLPEAEGARLLSEAEVRRVLADLSFHDGDLPGREAWQAVYLGGLLQATYRLRRCPETAVPGMVPQLLTVPAAATTVGVTVGPDGQAALAVRLAAPDRAALTVAAKGLRLVLAAHRATAEPCNGAQVRALAATLPLTDEHGACSLGAEAVARLRPSTGGAGLVLGVNRQNELVTVRLFRAEPTRASVVGTVRVAQLLTLRALAVGAQVVVQTARPQAWEPFVRAVSAPGDAVALVPPGRPPAPLLAPGSALRPRLAVVDVGPVAPDDVAHEAAWRTSLVVRDDLAAGDLDLLARSDLLVLQPLRADEAALAAGALGLGAAAEWLTRIRGEMVGVVNRHAVRWALLSATRVEQQLLGPLTRG